MAEVGQQPVMEQGRLRTACLKFLGIKRLEGLTFYGLMGIEEGETNEKIIDNAGEMRLGHVGKFGAGSDADLAREFSGFLSQVRGLLLEAAKKKVRLGQILEGQNGDTRSIDQPQAELGNYVLLEKLGEGGMGAVFKAKHKMMGRIVAIKVLSAAGLKDQRAVDRFQREVRAAAKLQHPNIVKAFDADHAGEQAFLVMEYVPGVDLAQRVKQQGPVEVETAINYIRQAGYGLEAAHRAGIVHRDIKPANLVLDDKGVVKILDMGLARIEHDEEQQNLTNTGQVVGTVTYMSPEQAMSTKHVDARTDIYSLGCTLHYLLTGSAPFKGETAMQTLMAHRLEPIPDLRATLPHVSPELQAVYQRMMAKAPNDRYANMTECLAALAALQPSAKLDTTARQADVTQEASDVALSNFLFAASNVAAWDAPPAADTATSQADVTTDLSPSSTNPSVLPARSWFQKPVGLASLGAGLVCLLLTVVFMLKTPSGMLIIEIDEPGATVSVDGDQKVLIQRPGGQQAVQVDVDHHQHELKVTKDGFTIFTRQFSMKGQPEHSIRVRLEPLAKPPVVSTPPPVRTGPFFGQSPGEERSDNSLSMKFCWCPPGKFMMGSPEKEKERDAKQEAQVEVTLTQGFWLGKYEVTQAEYERVMGKNPSAFSATGTSKEKVTGLDTSRFPVETVSWLDAEEYLKKLTEQERAAGRLPEGWEYRLPTEAEWEYACRAGTTTATAFGDALSNKQANFKGDAPYNGAEKSPSLGRTTTVGSYAPNAWGLYDMHGNVYEWCQDWYGSKLTGGTDPVVAQAASNRVRRGGGWNVSGGLCRSADRGGHTPGPRLFNLGFRVAIVPTAKSLPIPSNLPLKLGQQPGEEWNGNALGMPFCWCPAGKFMMGSPETEKDRGTDENQVEVTLTQGYWLGKYEVTQAEYERVMGKNPGAFSATGTSKDKVTGQDTSRFPVESVSWTEAEEYCRKLTEQERVAGRLPDGWEYRLPTEAQWEYACRAGTTTATAFGETLSSKQANFNGGSPYNNEEQGPSLGRTTTVGSYVGNAWGLYDMHGNVWEWCQDWFRNKLAGGTDPVVTQAASFRVCRGGGWYDYGKYCRSADRTFTPGSHNSNLGFRVAIVPSAKSLPTPTTLPLKLGQQPGEVWNGNALAMPFCWCPPGKFMMGSPETEKERGTDEDQVEVTLTQGFWLGKYEVTQAEYEKLMGKNPSWFCAAGEGATNVAGQDTSRFPVEMVRWTDAAEYCRKLTEQERAADRLPEGWEYRLPTEAQWEYACRAGTTKATAFGDTLSSKQANFFGGAPYNGAEKGPGLGRPTTVGSYAGNAWGLHDMHGNLWEWCQDWYGSKLAGGTDPVVTEAASHRVDRGGCWYDYGWRSRSAHRNFNTPTFHNGSVGFRVALVQSR